MNTVIVTGASGNLGQAVIQKFLQEGYDVIGTVIPNDPVPLDIKHPAFESRIVDLGNESDAGKFIAEVINKKQSIGSAVLTVGGFAMGKMADTSSADIQKQVRLNFETAYHVARPVFLQMMKQGKGRIFLVGSKPGLDARNGKGMVAYGLAKSMVIRLAEILNEEAKGTNVVTCVIVPSTIDTPQNRKSMPDADFNAWVKPEAIADIIYFYSSPASDPLRNPILKVFGNA